ncbi:MAG: thioredoxin domain-containing protein [Deltaproteobacteria bacterium]|nr:thioredoxin domain-containing protein [Deltaproteobacteria bacterium]MBN2672008.1 thioredoxin domain-containing protein [Deltaproteobacteria bacterium]
MINRQDQRNPSPATDASPFSIAYPLIILLISVLGLGVAAELTHIHYESHTNPEFHSICAINEALNCETVARSPYSVFLGLPISVWGLFAYTIFAVLCIFMLRQKKALAGVFLAAFSSALVASALLAYISTQIIQSLCLFCTTLYVVNTSLFIIGIFWVRSQHTSPMRLLVSDIQFMFSKLRFFVPFALNAAILLTATLLLFPRYWSQSLFSTLPTLPTGITDDGNHWIGAKNPKLTIVEFSDYECPFCRRAHYQMRQILARHAEEIRIVHKHMPMDNKCNEYLEQPFHDRACEFAKVVECAGKQGKFWEMNDMLFGIQDTVPTEQVDVDDLSEQLALDIAAMKKCMTSADVIQQIGANIDEASRRNIPGTPTYYVGAQPYPGGIPEETLIKYLKR